MQSNKVFVVTGAGNGIGFETARQLAEAGHRVAIITRSVEKGNAARDRIQAAHPDADVISFVADMSLLGDMHRVADQILETYPVVDGLINNVGTWMSDYVLTSEGIETVFATNHLSYFVLTHRLYPALRKSAHARIVNVSSNAHSYGRINLADPGYSKNYHGLRSNGQSKLANLYFTFELHKRKPDQHISTYAVSPGLVKTDIGLKHTSWLHAVAWKFRRRKGQSPAEGAGTSVYCALEPSIGEQSGLYWESKMPKEVFPSARDPKLGEQLWELSMAMSKLDRYFE